MVVLTLHAAERGGEVPKLDLAVDLFVIVDPMPLPLELFPNGSCLPVCVLENLQQIVEALHLLVLGYLDSAVSHRPFEVAVLDGIGVLGQIMDLKFVSQALDVDWQSRAGPLPEAGANWLAMLMAGLRGCPFGGRIGLTPLFHLALHLSISILLWAFLAAFSGFSSVLCLLHCLFESPRVHTLCPHLSPAASPSLWWIRPRLVATQQGPVIRHLRLQLVPELGQRLLLALCRSMQFAY